MQEHAANVRLALIKDGEMMESQASEAEQTEQRLNPSRPLTGELPSEGEISCFEQGLTAESSVEHGVVEQGEVEPAGPDSEGEATEAAPSSFGELKLEPIAPALDGLCLDTVDAHVREDEQDADAEEPVPGELTEVIFSFETRAADERRKRRQSASDDDYQQGEQLSCGRIDKSRSIWRQLLGILLALFALSPASAQAFQIGEDDQNYWKILTPDDDAVLPAGTRMVMLMTWKPFGFGGALKIQDPSGADSQRLLPAIFPFQITTIDQQGLPLPSGEWEATLFHSLDMGLPKDHISFTIEEGDGANLLPSIESPHHDQVFPSNIPAILFAGVGGAENTVWLEVYRVGDIQPTFAAAVQANLGGIWGYSAEWGYGEGEWIALVYGANPLLEHFPTDSTRFSTVSPLETDWPIFHPLFDDK